jgi:hypothetical protein
MGAMKALYMELHERLEHMSPKLLVICTRIEKAKADNNSQELNAATDDLDMMLDDYGWSISYNELASKEPNGG